MLFREPCSMTEFRGGYPHPIFPESNSYGSFISLVFVQFLMVLYAVGCDHSYGCKVLTQQITRVILKLKFKKSV